MFDKLLRLAKILFPTGRAFKMFDGSEFEKLTKALSKSEERFYNDAKFLLWAVLPDNSNFTADDCTDWERRLGLTYSPLSSVTDRKAAILRKLNSPCINPAKGNYLNLERELNLAGFNVKVYENIPATDPVTAGWSSLTTQIQYGVPSQYGGASQFGLAYSNKIANHIDEALDLSFSLGGSFACTFFIGGATVGTSANIPAVRKNEFRELILKIKQVQDVGFLYINYI